MITDEEDSVYTMDQEAAADQEDDEDDDEDMADDDDDESADYQESELDNDIANSDEEDIEGQDQVSEESDRKRKRDRVKADSRSSNNKVSHGKDVSHARRGVDPRRDSASGGGQSRQKGRENTPSKGTKPNRSGSRRN